MRASEYSFARRAPRGAKTADYYHCRLKAIGRSGGRSAVACAAYRTGMQIEDERYGTTRDFTHKKDVVTSFTLAPSDAPEWAHDTVQLWNRVEAFERRKDAQLAYEWEIALPNELSDAQREVIAHRFTSWLVEEYGVAATVGIHRGEHGTGNDHMHVMMTRRGVNADGFEKKILPQFSIKPGAPNPEVDRVREQVATLINDGLEAGGSAERVDHRSFKARGLGEEMVPTRHLGPAAAAMERAGIASELGDANRAIIEERLRWQHAQAQPDIAGEPLEADTPERQAEHRQPLPRGVGVAQPLARGVVAEEAQPQAEGFPLADRLQRLHAGVAAFWHEQTSEALRATLHRAGLAAGAVSGIAGWFERDDPAAMLRGLEKGAELAREVLAGDEGTEPAGGVWQTLVSAQRAIAEKAREFWHNERGSVPGEDLAQALWKAMQDEPEGEETPSFRPPQPETMEPERSPEPDIGPDFG